jgi:hypothetical protein
MRSIQLHELVCYSDSPDISICFLLLLTPVLKASDGSGRDTGHKPNPLKRDHPVVGTCIDIDGGTHSIYLAPDAGLVWRRRMTGVRGDQPPFQPSHRINHRSRPAGLRVAVDSVLMVNPRRYETGKNHVD